MKKDKVSMFTVLEQTDGLPFVKNRIHSEDEASLKALCGNSPMLSESLSTKGAGRFVNLQIDFDQQLDEIYVSIIPEYDLVVASKKVDANEDGVDVCAFIHLTDMSIDSFLPIIREDGQFKEVINTAYEQTFDL